MSVSWLNKQGIQNSGPSYPLCIVLGVLLSCVRLMDCAQAPLSMEFPRKEYWSRLPFPPSGDLHDPGTEQVPLASPALAGRFFTTRYLGNLLSS